MKPRINYDRIPSQRVCFAGRFVDTACVKRPGGELLPALFVRTDGNNVDTRILFESKELLDQVIACLQAARNKAWPGP